MNKKNILVWHWGRKGGAYKYGLDIIERLSLYNDINLHTSLSKQGEDYYSISKLNIKNIDINTYNNIFTAIISLLKVPLLISRLFKYIKDNKIDTIYCPSLHLWSFFVLPNVNKNKLNFILTLHDAVAHPGENKLFKKIWTRNAIKSARRIIALSEHVKSSIISEYNLDQGDLIEVVPHGAFDYSNGLAKPRDLPSKDKRQISLLFYGRIMEYKGIDILMEAYRIVKNQFPNLNLVIAGSGDFTKYKSKADKLEDLILHIRWIEEGEIKSLFDKSDILICPYIEASQSGSIAIALGFGMPVVATPVGGLIEQVTNGKTGLITKDTSPQSVADAIIKIISNRSLYRDLSVNAISESKNRFSWDSVAGDIYQILKSF